MQRKSGSTVPEGDAPPPPAAETNQVSAPLAGAGVSASADFATWSLADWLRYQEQLHPSTIELGLERVRRVAQRLGLPLAADSSEPQRRKPITLTVAGTNGKGSSSTLLAQIYREAGYRVGLYTSPHLLHYNERVAINGEPVSDAQLCTAFQHIQQARGADSLTYFEFGTLAALWLFAQAQVDVQVLEVGLGGRLDAVNVVDTDGALLTSVALDHQDWLGPDRESIGREKAGIFRAGRPAVCADPSPPASVREIAANIGAQWTLLGDDFSYVVDASDAELQPQWQWRSARHTLDALPAPGIAGEIQYRNAAAVLALVDALQTRLPVSENALRTALPKLRLPGRGEQQGRVILDVAHNEEAVAVLVRRLINQGWAGKVHWVLGMLADKPVEAVAAQLAPLARASYCGGLSSPRGLSAEALAMRAKILHPQCFSTITQAFIAATAACAADECIVVCGSFLTVAEVAERIDELEN